MAEFTIQDFAVQLSNIQGSYYSFVAAVITYVKKKQSRFDVVKNFVDSNTDASPSDVLEFISNQEDFYEDASYPQMQVG